jgi:pyrimidine 5'-nucleotidase
MEDITTIPRKALEDGTSRDALELVCTTDESNTPTPHGHTRAEMRLNNLWHRATYMLVIHEPVEEAETNSSNGEEERFILVQRRSLAKDYCPGKLDPTPGGVVGCNESYRENAERELQEEMGIDVCSDSTPNTMTRLFTFPYQDERVRVWGELFEVHYHGSMKDLRIQKEEVDEVLRMSLAELRTVTEQNRDEWMPDALHAIRLYLQFQEDHSLNRRRLHGYSSGNLDIYNLRPKPQVIFFDCDDCLYFDGWKVANKLTAKIDEWCVDRAGLPTGEAYQLYKKHGTALRGLLAEGYLEHSEEAIDDFLRDVHDIPIQDMIDVDHDLRKMILQIDPSIPKYIFTASVKHHAERCLKALGIDDLFVDIIDVKACNLHTKHSVEAFQAAMKIADVDNAESCLFLDDSTKNIHAARQVGWRSILVGRIGRDCGTVISTEHAEVEIDRIHDLPSVLPEIFRSANEKQRET